MFKHRAQISTVRPLQPSHVLRSTVVENDDTQVHNGVQSSIRNMLENVALTESASGSIIDPPLSIHVPQPPDLTQPVKAGWSVKVMGKLLNFWGLLYGVSIVITAVTFVPFMFALTLYADATGDYKVRKVN